MKKISLLLTVIFLLIASAISAGNVSLYVSTNVAQNWLNFHSRNLEENWNGAINPQIDECRYLISDLDTMAYVFLINPSGYIVVAKYNEIVPVIAYSTTEQLDINSDYSFAKILQADLLKRNKLVKDFLTGQITLDDNPNGMPAIEINWQKWDIWSLDTRAFESQYNNYFPDNIMDVDPLLESTWHQGEPYYNLCPIGNGGERCVVGCVATATAQIMRYWQWPPAGDSSHIYLWDGDGNEPGYNLIGDFSDPYDWSNILLDYSGGYNNDQAFAVAELCYEVGVGYEMDYHVSGSGAYTSHCVSVLPKYFRYSNEIDQESRPDHTADSWFNIISAELDLERPLLYRIYQSGWGGHAIVCDGWRISGGENQLHFNYGWADGHNTWYTVDNLYPGSPENDRCYHGIVPADDDIRSITVISPNGGESWFRGSAVHIAWDFEGNIGEYIKIDLYNGGNYDNPIADSTTNDGYYSWFIPYEQSEGSDYQIKISSLDNSVSDMSDEYFAIEQYENVDTVRIYDENQLQLISTGGAYPRDAYYLLMNDINLSWFDFVPIGSNPEYYFRGTFDGQGYSISDLQIDRETESYIGLFSIIDHRGVVKDITLLDPEIRGYRYVGAFAGFNEGSIINCTVTASVSGGGSIRGRSRIGGITGENTGVISQCTVTDHDDSHGIYLRANVENVGGIVGVTGEGSGNNALVEFCLVDCRINGREDYNGGIAGGNYDSIIGCVYINGTIDGRDWGNGGIVGWNHSGLIKNCSFIGTLNGDTFNGGIVGWFEGGTIEECYAAGPIYDSEKGGIAGRCNGTISKCFWDTQVTGCDEAYYDGSCTIINSHGEITSEMMQESTFTTQYNTNWDFISVWAIDENNSYPMLRNVGDILSPPDGLTASSDQSDGVHLSWNHVSYDLVGGPYNAVYRVYRSNGPDEYPPELELTSEWQTSNSFIDNTALPGAAYYYTLKAAATNSGTRESDFSSYVQGYRAFLPLEVPTGISASDGLEVLIYIHWDIVPNANYYKVFRANSLDGTKIELGNWQTELSFDDVPEFSDTVYYYWVKAAIDNSGGRESDYGGPDEGYYIFIPTDIDDENVLPIPDAFSLSQNFPNPFNSQSTINYGLPKSAHVVIKIYDILGRQVKILVDSEKSAGYHQVVWNSNNLSSGIFFYKIHAGDFVETKKMLLLK